MALELDLLRDGNVVSSFAGQTDLDGIAVLTGPAATGVHTIRVRSVTAPGMAWDGWTPPGTFTGMPATVTGVAYAMAGRDLVVTVTGTLQATVPSWFTIDFDVLRNGATASSAAQGGYCAAGACSWSGQYTLPNARRGTYTTRVTGLRPDQDPVHPTFVGVGPTPATSYQR